MQWSSYQQAVFDDIGKGRGHTVVRARAGSGKTTTIIEGLKHLGIDDDGLLCAFNKGIATELGRRVPKSADVEVKTMHQIGLRALGKRRRVTVDPDKGRNIAREVEDATKFGGIAGRLARVAGFAKNIMADDVKDEAELHSRLTDIVIQLGAEDDKITAKELVPLVAKCLELAEAHFPLVDFDDMVWLPAKFNARPETYSMVLVDETQDLNRAQLWLARQSVRKGGRIIAVGDDRQAIYGFRGADDRAMVDIIENLSAKVLPLSISYRCPRAVVDLAKTVVPDIESAPGAPDGLVAWVGSDMLTDARRGPRPGDFVLSRTNAPLMPVCIEMLRNRVPCTVAGKDIGRSMIALADRSHARRVADMIAWLKDYRDREFERLLALEKEDLFPAVADKIDALMAVSSGLDSVDEVRDVIGRMFSDSDDDSVVTCSTVHKAKGLERDRVWLLHSTFGGKGRQLENLFYVAVTRAKKDLFLVAGEGATIAPSTDCALEDAFRHPKTDHDGMLDDSEGPDHGGDIPW